MCTNYKPVTDEDRLLAHFGVARPEEEAPPETYIGYLSPFIVSPEHRAALERTCVVGVYGLLPEWAPNLVYGRSTYNCRAESMRTKPSFKDAWFGGYRCIIPTELMYEVCWESGDPVRWAIKRDNSDPMGVAGLWGVWHDKRTGAEVLSFTMITINGDGHAVYGRMHEPGDEKRMPVILHREDYDAWLTCPLDDASKFLQRYPAELLQTYPEPAPWKTLPEPASWATEPDLFEDEWREAAVDPKARQLKARRSRPKLKPAGSPPTPPEPDSGDLFS
jgi:putative SOS response-associated peptidase YedK